MNRAHCILRALFLFTVGWCAAPKCYENQYMTPVPEDTAEQQTLEDGGVPLPPNYISEYPIPLTGADGVDLLIVVDTGPGMHQAQQRLSEAVATLIDNLTAPPANVWQWGFPEISDLRIAVASADMGLQAGGSINTKQLTVETCENPTGDNGNFLDIKDEVAFVLLEDTVEPCSGTDTSVDAACRVQQGTDGCLVSQPLEAMVRSLEKEPAFLLETHALAVIIVTDDDDCSIKDTALLDAPEWADPATVAVACHATPENESRLYDTTRYVEKLKTFKSGDLGRTLFAAVAGTFPLNGCEGGGLGLAGAECLSTPNMDRLITPIDPDGAVLSWVPSCTTEPNFPDDAAEAFYTTAAPGRRLMETAQKLGRNGLLYSICRDDWTGPFSTIGKTIANKTDPLCLPMGLPWALVDNSCIACGHVTDACDLFLELDADANAACPETLYENLSRNQRAQMQVRIHTGIGEDDLPVLFCPVPKLSTPIECAGTDASVVWESHTGWVYCLDDGTCAHRIRLTDSVRKFEQENARRRIIKCDRPY